MRLAAENKVYKRLPFTAKSLKIMHNFVFFQAVYHIRLVTFSPRCRLYIAKVALKRQIILAALITGARIP
ncbi:hypothetical protein B4900_04650 [Yersinia rohdei]|nr:hypothetical protein B4900_04650 [Yersinia rohdei]